MMTKYDRDYRRHASRADNECKVFMGGLSTHWHEDDIAAFMSQFGRIVQISIVKTGNGDSKGFGFVVFS